AELELLIRLPPLRIVAIGEDWCPDVYHTLPTWARVAEEVPGWELRVFARDARGELMDAFLWRNEARRIPVFAFYDSKGSLQVWWSGRGAAAQRFYEDLLAGRSFGDLDEDEIAELVKSFDEAYRSRFRRENFEEILTLLRAFFHLG
ncbi:MAG: thioredoxin family protein, partial [Thermoanaerobaculia bacterium]